MNMAAEMIPEGCLGIKEMKGRKQWEHHVQKPCGRRERGPFQKLAEAQVFLA